MGKLKRGYYDMTVEEFKKDKWPLIKAELEGYMKAGGGAASGPPGGPAGGVSAGVDSLVAVVATAVVIKDHMGKTPPAEEIIQEGGYETEEDFVNDVEKKLSALCWKDENEKENKNKATEAAE